MKHDGYKTHRLTEDNPREVAFSDMWKVLNKQGNILDWLIPNATPRDAEVSATIVQWLGSNVGVAFLKDVISKSPELKRDLKTVING